MENRTESVLVSMSVSASSDLRSIIKLSSFILKDRERAQAQVA